MLHGISLEIEKAIVALLGSNGAGKTTTINTTGLNQVHEGDILFQGQSICQLPTHERVQQGVVASKAAFPYMTVYDNLLIGSYAPRRARTCGEYR